MKSINVNVKIRFKDMNKYSKEFHVALVNELLNKGEKNLELLDVTIEKVKGSDISYDYSKLDSL